MSATVRPNPHGGTGWVSHCQECSAIFTGTMSAVDLWADIHNAYKHGEGA